MSLSNIVNVVITRQTKAVSQAGFSTLLITGPTAAWVEPVRFYNDMTGVGTDFATGDPEYLAALAAFSQTPRPSKIAIGKAGATVGAGLDAINAYSDDWYALVMASRTHADQVAAAGWIEARKKIFFARTNAAGVIDGASTTDIAYVTSNAGYDRTFVIYHNAATDEFIDAAVAGTMLPRAPGSATYAFKTLSGISANKMTASAETATLNKNANVYTTIGGARILREGRMASGEFADIITGIDWFESRLQERIFARFVNLPKIPFTDAGIAIVENEIRAQLNEGITAQLIATDPPFTVTVPLVADISANDRANRLLPDVSFFAYLSGAVHKTNISGTVAV